eukprot:Opistho-2@76604
MGLLFLFLAFIVAATFYEQDPTKRVQLCPPHARLDLYDLFVRASLTILWNLLDSPSTHWVLVGALLFGSCTLAFAHIWFIPYTRWHFSVTKAVFSSIFAWSAVCLLFAMISNNPAYGEAYYMFFVVSPLVALCAIFLIGSRRRSLSATPTSKLRNAAELELKIRFHLEDNGLLFCRPEDDDTHAKQIYAEINRWYIESAKRWPESTLLPLFWGHFFLIYMKNKNMATTQFDRADTRKAHLDIRYVVYRRRTMMSDEFSSGSHDVIAFVEFQKFMADARRYHKKAARSQLDFWVELMQSSPDLHKLHTLSTQITRSVTSAQQSFTKLMKLNSTSSQLLRMYAGFQINVLNNTPYGDELLQMAEELENRRVDQVDEDGDGQLEHLNVLEDTNASVTISGQNKKEGDIVDVNTAACQLLGYRRSDLVGKNITLIIPHPYEIDHALHIRKYLETGIGAIVDKTRLVIVQHKSGAILPAFIMVKQVSRAGGVCFLGVIKPIKTSDHYVAIANDGVVMSCSASCVGLFGASMELVKNGAVNVTDWIPNFELDNPHDLVSVMQRPEDEAATILRVNTTPIEINGVAFHLLKVRSQIQGTTVQQSDSDQSFRNHAMPGAMVGSTRPKDGAGAHRPPIPEVPENDAAVPPLLAINGAGGEKGATQLANRRVHVTPSFHTNPEDSAAFELANAFTQGEEDEHAYTHIHASTYHGTHRYNADASAGKNVAHIMYEDEHGDAVGGMGPLPGALSAPPNASPMVRSATHISHTRPHVSMGPTLEINGAYHMKAGSRPFSRPSSPPIITEGDVNVEMTEVRHSQPDADAIASLGDEGVGFPRSKDNPSISRSDDSSFDADESGNKGRDNGSSHRMRPAFDESVKNTSEGNAPRKSRPSGGSSVKSGGSNTSGRSRMEQMRRQMFVGSSQSRSIESTRFLAAAATTVVVLSVLAIAGFIVVRSKMMDSDRTFISIAEASARQIEALRVAHIVRTLMLPDSVVGYHNKTQDQLLLRGQIATLRALHDALFQRGGSGSQAQGSLYMTPSTLFYTEQDGVGRSVQMSLADALEAFINKAYRVSMMPISAVDASSSDARVVYMNVFGALFASLAQSVELYQQSISDDVDTILGTAKGFTAGALSFLCFVTIFVLLPMLALIEVKRNRLVDLFMRIPISVVSALYDRTRQSLSDMEGLDAPDDDADFWAEAPSTTGEETSVVVVNGRRNQRRGDATHNHRARLISLLRMQKRGFIRILILVGLGLAFFIPYYVLCNDTMAGAVTISREIDLSDRRSFQARKTHFMVREMIVAGDHNSFNRMTALAENSIAVLTQVESALVYGNASFGLSTSALGSSGQPAILFGSACVPASPPSCTEYDSGFLTRGLHATILEFVDAGLDMVTSVSQAANGSIIPASHQQALLTLPRMSFLRDLDTDYLTPPIDACTSLYRQSKQGKVDSYDTTMLIILCVVVPMYSALI